MPSYICTKCGCIDNTACGGNYWNVIGKLNLFKDEYSNNNVLCTECAPSIFSDNSKNREAGKWHNRFPKKHWSTYGTKEELLKEFEEDPNNSLINVNEYFKNYKEKEMSKIISEIRYEKFIIDDGLPSSFEIPYMRFFIEEVEGDEPFRMTLEFKRKEDSEIEIYSNLYGKKNIKEKNMEELKKQVTNLEFLRIIAKIKLEYLMRSEISEKRKKDNS
jgi:hypothetical protein